MHWRFGKEALIGFLFLYGRSLTWAILGSVTIFGVVGCASIDKSDFRQVVLVRSEPPGAVVYQDGERIGVTPGYMKVKRSQYPKISLQMKDQAPVELTLRSHYRWADSFATNLIEYALAPVGWTVDLLTGAAWRMDNPPVQEFPGVTGPPFADTTRVVAIAPPVTKDVEVADALGRLAEQRLREKTSYEIVPYDRTEQLFSYFASDEGMTEDQAQRYRLFYQANADHIFWSQASPIENGYEVSGNIKSIYTDKEGKTISWDVSADRSEIDKIGFIEKYIHLLPNTVFLNFAAFNSANYSTTIDVDGYTARSGLVSNQSGFEQMLGLVSSLSLSHLDRPRPNGKGHWVFDFVPTFVFSDRRIQYQDYPPLEGVQFNRWYVSGGYGIEVGHQSRYGLFYLDVIPSLTWTQLKFATSEVDERISNTTVTVVTEIGWSYFFTRHLVGKLFTRNYTEDSHLWERAVSDITGRTANISSVASLQAGIAVGYYFPISAHGSSLWKVHDN